MKLIDKHKAALITALITGIVLLTMFNMHLTQHDTLISETYYTMPSEEETAKALEQKQLEEQALQAKAETNKGFNDSQDNKHFAKAYTPIAPPKEYDKSRFTQTEDLTETQEPTEETNSASESSSIDADEISSFNSVNSILNATAQNKSKANASNGNNASGNIAINTSVNKNSSMHYSLKDRTHVYLPTPIYLCEASGKVVINITVNTTGDVVDTYVNTSSTTKNECLIDSALEYAKKARFSTDASKPSQIGSITFYFEGKN
ncbi:energy transducer TonB [Formosa sp. 3Alg 14/1]|uniref:energy transducer TonB n=1 Tax=Formosa sp. 3Alg 14/1 TaxID=3382190 RepID=UPI0039BDFA7B